ncbi:MAG: TRAP transporter substrate-binding protein [Burkholderiales bacterium]|nr:MAG: TRAP transporter substrate-binding protein [Burkholderiales bacterium]
MTLMSSSVLKAAGAAAVAALIAAPAAAQQTYKWDMPTPYSDKEFMTQNVHMFVADLARITGGRMSITVHSGNSLIKNPEIKRAVQLKQVPIAELFISNLSREDPVFEIDAIPFFAANYPAALKLYQVTRPIMQEKLNKQGLQLLYAVPWPSQAFYTKEPVNSIADLKGKKMRAYNEQTSRLAELMNTVPTTVQATEIPQAFSTGIIDAMFTSAQTGVTYKSWDFTNYVYNTQAWVPKNVVFMNKEVYDGLPDDIKAAIAQAAATAEVRGWMLSIESDIKKPQELAAAGMKVQNIEGKVAEELKAIGEKMLENWLKKAGDEGKAIVEAYRAIKY